MNGEAIQGALYRSVWGYRDPTPPETQMWLDHAPCYADIFSHYGMFKQTLLKGTANELVSLFRLHKEGMTVSMANWFLHKYVLAILPARVRESVSIKRCFSKGYFAMVEAAKRPNIGYVRRVNEDTKCIPWLDIRVDATKANMHDVFLLFTLVRTVQEYPRAIHIMYQLAEAHGLPLETAFFLACMDTNGGGHALISTSSFYDSIPNLDDVLDWSLEKRWEAMKAYVETQYKLGYPCIKENNSKHMDISSWLVEDMRRTHWQRAIGSDPWDEPPESRDETSWAVGFHLQQKVVKLIEGLLI